MFWAEGVLRGEEGEAVGEATDLAAQEVVGVVIFPAIRLNVS